MGARPVLAPLLVRPRCGLRAVAQRAVLARLRAHVIARVVGTGVAVGGRAETLHRLRNRNRCSTATTALRRPIAYNVVLPNNCILRNQQNSRTYTNQPKTSERRRIGMSAVYHSFARRGGSDQHVFR